MATNFKNQIIGLKELRINTDEYINRVGRGESFAIIRRSRPIFKISPLDEDDDSLWETVVDFTSINKNGVPAYKVLKALKKLNAEN